MVKCLIQARVLGKWLSQNLNPSACSLGDPDTKLTSWHLSSPLTANLCLTQSLGNATCRALSWLVQLQF